MRRLIAIAIAALVFGAPSGVAAYQKMWPQASGGERRRGLKRASLPAVSVLRGQFCDGHRRIHPL